MITLIQQEEETPLTLILPSRVETISPIILTRSSYLYVLSVSHTASRMVRISLLMNLGCGDGVTALSSLPKAGVWLG